MNKSELEQILFYLAVRKNIAVRRAARGSARRGVLPVEGGLGAALRDVDARPELRARGGGALHGAAGEARHARRLL